MSCSPYPPGLAIRPQHLAPLFIANFGTEFSYQSGKDMVYFSITLFFEFLDRAVELTTTYCNAFNINMSLLKVPWLMLEARVYYSSTTPPFLSHYACDYGHARSDAAELILINVFTSFEPNDSLHALSLFIPTLPCFVPVCCNALFGASEACLALMR
jgi:hypothetical protein